MKANNDYDAFYKQLNYVAPITRIRLDCLTTRKSGSVELFQLVPLSGFPNDPRGGLVSRLARRFLLRFFGFDSSASVSRASPFSVVLRLEPSRTAPVHVV